jgi:hypothetical protein
MTDGLLGRLLDHLTLGGVLAGVLFIAVTAALGLAVASFWLVTLPATYFQDGHRRDWGPDLPPALRFLLRILKNLCGAFLIAVGLLLTLPGVPGPGVLTAILGFTLIDFPGKRSLERRIIRRPTVLSAINRLRARHGRPPLAFDDPCG